MPRKQILPTLEIIQGSSVYELMVYRRLSFHSHLRRTSRAFGSKFLRVGMVCTLSQTLPAGPPCEIGA